MTLRAPLALLLTGSILQAGCGSSSPGTDPGPASALAMCEAFIPAFQAKSAACSSSGIPEAIAPAYLGLAFNCQTFAEAQAAGRIAFDQAKAKACLDTLGAATCATAFSGGLFNADCLAAVAPRVAAGGTCFSEFGIECVAGFCDHSAAAACTTGGRCVTSATLGMPCSPTMECATGLRCEPSGTCGVRPVITVVGAGVSCATIGTACADGLFCDNSVTPRACAPMKALGASCAGGATCQPGLLCDGVSTTCVYRPKLGEACVQGQGRCAGNTYCGVSNTCTPSPRVGQDCRPAGGETVFCQDSWCQPAVAPSTARACAPYAAPGAACSTTNPVQCGLGYQCTGAPGVCGRNYCFGG